MSISGSCRTVSNTRSGGHGRVQQLVQAFNCMDGLLTALAFLALLAGALIRGRSLSDSASFGWVVCGRLVSCSASGASGIGSLASFAFDDRCRHTHLLGKVVCPCGLVRNPLRQGCLILLLSWSQSPTDSARSRRPYWSAASCCLTAAQSDAMSVSTWSSDKPLGM